MKQMHKLCRTLLMICLLLAVLPQTISAGQGLKFHAKTSGSERTIYVKKITYEGENKNLRRGNKTLHELDVDFSSDVTWEPRAKVSSVKDNKGKSYRGYLWEIDDDSCEIAIAGLKQGRTYTIKITGIRHRQAASFGRLTLKVKIPVQKPASSDISVRKVSVDEADGEVDVKFASKVLWKYDAEVISVKDNKGKKYRGYLTDTDDDECELYIDGMKYGRTYTIRISGIKERGASAYKTVAIKVKVRAQKNSLRVKRVTYDEDYDDGRMEWEVSFAFNKDVVHKVGSYVIIRDAGGKVYASRSSYVDWDDDECDVRLSEGLTLGRTYTYEIKNVKAAGTGKYMTLKGQFTARY